MVKGDRLEKMKEIERTEGKVTARKFMRARASEWDRVSTIDSICPTQVKTRPPRILTRTPGPHYSETYEIEVEPDAAMLPRTRNPLW